MPSALIKFCIIKHSPVQFRSIWNILDRKMHFMACFVSKIAKNGVFNDAMVNNILGFIINKDLGLNHIGDLGTVGP